RSSDTDSEKTGDYASQVAPTHYFIIWATESFFRRFMAYYWRCVVSQSFTDSASGWRARVDSGLKSMSAVLSHCHMVIRSVPTKRLNIQTGIGKRDGFLSITSR